MEPYQTSNLGYKLTKRSTALLRAIADDMALHLLKKEQKKILFHLLTKPSIDGYRHANSITDLDKI